MEALWATILFSGFALEVIIRLRKMTIESVVIQTNTFISEGYGKLRQVSNRKPG